jgi:hypothetical protein
VVRSKRIAIGVWVILAGATMACLAAADVMNWQGSQFSGITLPAITTRAGVATGSATLALDLSGDVQISADNTVNAELRGPNGAALVTEYALSFNGNGTNASGATNVAYTAYDSFLNPPVQVTHVLGDDEVLVTLSVKASLPPGAVSDAGAYTAHASLTASWVGP